MKSGKLYFGSNLKMYKGIADTAAFLTELQQLTADLDREQIELFILPSYTSLPEAAKVTDQHLIRLGAQNMGWEEEGQFTGEISCRMLAELGIGMVMAGHSERRHVFRETDEDERLKVRCALDHGMIPLLCIGETGEDKGYGVSREVLAVQLKIGLHGLSDEEARRVRVAYEPVWSIGVHGTPAEPSYAEEMHASIKATLREIFPNVWEEIPVLYGGSVNPGNACALIALPSVDGLYVGRSAWQADKFNILIRDAIGAARAAGK